VETTPVIYILLTGFPANSNVGVLNIATVAEFQPTPNTATTNKTDYPNDYPNTRNIVRTLLTRYPTIQSLTLSDVRKLVSFITRQKTWQADTFYGVV